VVIEHLPPPIRYIVSRSEADRPSGVKGGLLPRNAKSL
jgi:hypothetical protein